MDAVSRISVVGYFYPAGDQTFHKLVKTTPQNLQPIT